MGNKKRFIEQVAFCFLALLGHGIFEVQYVKESAAHSGYLGESVEALELLDINGNLVSSLALRVEDIKRNDPEFLAGYWYGQL